MSGFRLGLGMESGSMMYFYNKTVCAMAGVPTCVLVGSRSGFCLIMVVGL